MITFLKDFALGSITYKSKILVFIFLTALSILITNKILESLELTAQIPDKISNMDIYNFIFSREFVICLFIFSCIFLAIVIYNREILTPITKKSALPLNFIFWLIIKIIGLILLSPFLLFRKRKLKGGWIRPKVTLKDLWKNPTVKFIDLLVIYHIVVIEGDSISKGKNYEENKELLQEIVSEPEEINENVCRNCTIFISVLITYIIYDLNSFLNSWILLCLWFMVGFSYTATSVVNYVLHKKQEVLLNILRSSKEYKPTPEPEGLILKKKCKKSKIKIDPDSKQAPTDEQK